MRRVFLSLNSQFDSSQPFKVPKLPPKKLVSIKSFNVPNISFLPVIPKEKFPPKIKFIPSIKKLKIGTTTIIASTKDAISKGLKSDKNCLVCFIKIFKKLTKFYYASSIELNLQKSN